eukprot:TRINITY_DN12248_c0_g1_i1.p1 TRINITY_DN12248_c0_g1~~TRINITY_DN12248_c0_g1_i1.p1  ORF type:complete len:765 (+),score=260.68 TRINITY_DN12248_c0_g1_i1:70-2364(+)
MPSAEAAQKARMGLELLKSTLSSESEGSGPAAAAPSSSSTASAVAFVASPSRVSSALPPKAASISERVIGLSEFLRSLKLSQYEVQAIAWCVREGAAELDEVKDSWEDLADCLKLRPMERKRLEKAAMGASADPSPQAAKSAAVVLQASTSPHSTSAGSGTGFAAASSSGTAGTDVKEVEKAPSFPAWLPAEEIPAEDAEFAAPPEADLLEDDYDSADEPLLEHFGPLEAPERYELLEQIGAGATATVLRCRRVEDSQVFAAKTIALDKMRRKPEYARMLEMIHQEVAILLALQHPKVIDLIDVVEEADKLRLVMELVEGGGLDSYIYKQGALPEWQAANVFAQVTQALRYIHDKGVVHRDLKPDNILVEETTTAVEGKEGLLSVKLTDFGHAKVVGDWYCAAPRKAGTPLYMAPEVHDPDQAVAGFEACADLWSLGVVLYVMLLGYYPFNACGTSLQEAVQKGAFDFWSDDDRAPPSKEAQSLVRSLLKLDPKKRLALDWCVVHPFVAGSGALVLQLLKLPSRSEVIFEERYHLPTWTSDRQGLLLRQDLRRWMLKCRYSAVMRGPEVLATYGREDAVEWDSVEVAHLELLEIMSFHIGARRAARGNVADVVARRMTQRSKEEAAALKAAAEAAQKEAEARRAAAEARAEAERAKRAAAEQARKAAAAARQQALAQAPKKEADESEEAARARRIETRRRIDNAVAPRWNFSGASANGGANVDDRFREHEANLDRQRRLAYRGPAEEDVEEVKAQKAKAKAKRG